MLLRVSAHSFVITFSLLISNLSQIVYNIFYVFYVYSGETVFNLNVNGLNNS